MKADKIYICLEVKDTHASDHYVVLYIYHYEKKRCQHAVDLALTGPDAAGGAWQHLALMNSAIAVLKRTSLCVCHD